MHSKQTMRSIFLTLACFCADLLQGKEVWSPELTYEKLVEDARRGSPYSMGLLGIYLRAGEAGCSVSPEASRKWSEAALAKGEPMGSYNLANLAMLDGNFKEATRLYQDAALLLQRRSSDGDPVAMYCMGEIDFQVIPTNIPRALELFEKSAELGFPQAQGTLGGLYLKGLPGILEKKPKAGIALLSQAVRSNSMTGRFNLGMAFLNGEGVERDYQKAAQWLELAQRQNFSEAQFALGILFFEGEEGVPQNPSRGIELLKSAAAQNHSLARKYLSGIADGESVPAYRGESARIEEPSAMKSDEEALLEARRYFTGYGRQKDYSKAYLLLLPLAQKGYAEAARLVGMMNLSGKGVEKNSNEARRWLILAAQKGDETARRMLEQYKNLF